MRPAIREKKVSATLKVSLWFNNRHTLGSYRGLNQSEIVKGGYSGYSTGIQCFPQDFVRLVAAGDVTY